MRALRAGPAPLLAALVLLAACGSPGPVSKATDLTPSQAPNTLPSGSASSEPGSTPPTDATGQPTAPATSTPTTAPTTAPTAGSPAPATVGPTGPLGTPGDLASCSGSDDNRLFFESTAGRVTFDVYCASLPKGWFVDTGSLRSGELNISYETAAGLRFELRQGNYCTGSAAECGPLDSVIGSAMFGDREGQLGRLGADLVLYVNPGSNPSWQATESGLDEATFRSLAAALVRVPG